MATTMHSSNQAAGGPPGGGGRPPGGNRGGPDKTTALFEYPKTKSAKEYILAWRKCPRWPLGCWLLLIACSSWSLWSGGYPSASH